MTARQVRIVLDTSAIVAYTRGSIDVGEVIAEVDDERAAAALPVLCLVEATQHIVDAGHLDLLVNHSATVVIAAEARDWRALAEVHERVGRLDATTAVLAAARRRCQVLSRQPGLYGGLSNGGPIIPI
ncbi:MAG TPA: hypothetical protein VI011_00865 [Asanoa sp.]